MVHVLKLPAVEDRSTVHGPSIPAYVTFALNQQFLSWTLHLL